MIALPDSTNAKDGQTFTFLYMQDSIPPSFSNGIIVLLSSTYAFDLYHFLIWILWFILIVYR
jgi:hypothetical protein